MNLLDRISYDTGGYTVQEILSSFCNKILEIIDLVNKNEEVCDEAHTIIENIRNEVVPELVNDMIKEMQDSGYFDSLVNVTLIEQLRTELTTLLNQTITDLTTRLDNFDSQLDNMEKQRIQVINIKEVLGTGDISTKFNELLTKLNENNSTTIYFPSGEYILKDTTLISNLTIIGDGITSILKCKNNKPILSILSCDNVIVENVKLDGERSEKVYYEKGDNIRVENSTNIKIKNCHSANAVAEGIGFFENSSYCYAIDNKCIGCGHSGIATGIYANHITIDGNEVNNCGGNFISINGDYSICKNNFCYGIGGLTNEWAYGITLGQPTTYKANNCIIEGNIIDSMYGGGISVLEDCNDNKILNNIITSCKRGYGIQIYGSFNLVSGNSINTVNGSDNENSGKGIVIKSLYNTIKGNKIENCQKDGIACIEGEYITVSDNIIIGNTRFGIALNNIKMLRVNNNTVKNNGYGIRIQSLCTNVVVNDNYSVSNTNNNFDIQPKCYANNNSNSIDLNCGTLTLTGTTKVNFTHNLGRNNYMVILTPLSELKGKLVLEKYNNEFHLKSTDATDVSKVDFKIID